MTIYRYNMISCNFWSYLTIMFLLVSQLRLVPTITTSSIIIAQHSTIITKMSTHPNLRLHPPYPSSASIEVDVGFTDLTT